MANNSCERKAAEREAQDDAMKKRIDGMMQDHINFTAFILLSDGEEWMSDLLLAMTKNPKMINCSEMAEKYREYTQAGYQE